MNLAAIVLTPLAAISFLMAGCQHAKAHRPAPAAPPADSVISDMYAPSPRLLVGRIIAVDPVRGFAFVELAADAPKAAIAADTELTARSLDLRESARLRVSRHVRGRTLSSIILAGKPATGDEVVWLAP